MQSPSVHTAVKNAPSSKGPLVQFARFVNGQLELFSARTGDEQYIAISHVWGKIEWLRIPGIAEDVLASPEKARFIKEQLPGLVGSSAFWMDTLTVNQRNKAEVIATVQVMPAIFRDAVATIAVREDDGIYVCCARAVADFKDWHDLSEKLLRHSDCHSDHVIDESYLQRLWTMQECLLSHTIHFVVSNNGRQLQLGPCAKCSN
jgi:hypothetical protein